MEPRTEQRFLAACLRRQLLRQLRSGATLAFAGMAHVEVVLSVRRDEVHWMVREGKRVADAGRALAARTAAMDACERAAKRIVDGELAARAA